MHTIIINGSPRKDGNTAKMCRAFADGVAVYSKEEPAEIIHLYEYDFKGCRSCFACKRKNATTYGRCVVKDAIAPILKKALQADILVLASPIYLMDISGELKSFIERLLFPIASYEAGYKSIAPKRMQVATIYTMNVPQAMCPRPVLDNTEYFIRHVLNVPHRLCAYDTYQFDDYSRYVVEVFDETQKRQHRDQTFPIELQQAYQLGKEMAQAIMEKAKHPSQEVSPCQQTENSHHPDIHL